MGDFAQTISGFNATLSSLFSLGGPVVLLLIAMSILALAIIVAKIAQFWRVHINDRHTARSALKVFRKGNYSAAITLARRSPDPASRTLARAIQLRSRPGMSESALREEVLQYGGDMLESLRSHLRPLEVIASLAPLLGLFGTVLGMIEAFRNLEAAGSQVNPALLSGGIWQALLTTAVGLAVAMPVTVALNWLERAVDRAAHEMDSVVTRVFTSDLHAPVSAHEPVDAQENDDAEPGQSTPFF